MHWKTSVFARGSRWCKGTPLAPLAEQLNRMAARTTYGLHERLLSNPPSRRQLAAHAPALDAGQRLVLEGLQTKGIAVLSLEEFFGAAGPHLWERLRTEGAGFVERVEAGLAERAQKADAKRRSREERGKAKEKARGKGDIIIRLLGKDVPVLPADDPWLQLGIADRMLDVVNSYFGLWSRLSYVDLWYTPPSGPDAERVSSQRWHRDYNDQRLVKVFVYLTDVDEGTGPFEYVAESALGGRYAGAWPWKPVGNDLYPPQREFDQRIPKAAQMTLTGRAGTMIFCNTSGFHRGGYATGDRPRVMAVYNYVSPASLASLTLRNFAVNGQSVDLSPAATFALD